MIVLVAIDRESNNYRIEKSGIPDIGTTTPEIIADIEFQFIAAGTHDVALKQWLLGAPIGIRRCTRDQFTVVIESK